MLCYYYIWSIFSHVQKISLDIFSNYFFAVYSTQKKTRLPILVFYTFRHTLGLAKNILCNKSEVLRTFLRKAAMCVRSPHFCSPLLLARGVHFTNVRFSSFAEQTKKHTREMAAGKAAN